jgi:hypothetical protein
MRRDVPLAPDPTPGAGLARQAGASQLAPRHQRRLLVALATPPVAWTVHLLGAYLVVALWCAQSWPHEGVAIAILTALCALACAGAAALAFRLWRIGQDARLVDSEPGEPEPWDGRMGERGARTAFLAVLAVCMAALFGWLVVLQGLPAAFGDACSATTRP